MTSFNNMCYRLAKQIPRGKVSTYKAIAHALGTNAYRAVGNAMHNNPFAPSVPCHRVVKSNGNVGGFANGTKKKIELLRSEGVDIKDGKIDLVRFLYNNFYKP